MNLLTLNSKKIELSNANQNTYLISMLYLLPYTYSGHQTCPSASIGCSTTCLNFAGRGKTNLVQNARQRKTDLLFNDRNKFLELLQEDILKFSKKCKNLGKKPVIICFNYA